MPRLYLPYCPTVGFKNKNMNRIAQAFLTLLALVLIAAQMEDQKLANGVRQGCQRPPMAVPCDNGPRSANAGGEPFRRAARTGAEARATPQESEELLDKLRRLGSPVETLPDGMFCVMIGLPEITEDEDIALAATGTLGFLALRDARFPNVAPMLGDKIKNCGSLILVVAGSPTRALRFSRSCPGFGCSTCRIRKLRMRGLHVVEGAGVSSDARPSQYQRHERGHPGP